MSKYDANSIKSLKGLEPVRKRPGMYIGSTDVNGLHHLVWEIVDNSMDEALATFANKIQITIKNDQSVIVEDNGRGIPVGIHSKGKTAVEVIFTELHSGGKFNEGAYKTSGGLHGVGSSVVNALSTKLIATVYKNGKEYETIFENGDKIIQRTRVVGNTTKCGTKVQFWPNEIIFKRAKLNYEIIAERLRESSFLIPNIIIQFKDERDFKSITFENGDGIRAFVKFINDSKKTYQKKIISFKAIKAKMEADIAFQYTDSYNETILSFVNNVKTRDGGTHETAFKTALTKSVNEYAKENNLLKGKINSLNGDDIREGITAVISVKIPEGILEFVGQTKDKLGTTDVKIVIDEIMQRQLKYWLIENKIEATKIIAKARMASEARMAARKARKDSRDAKNKLKTNKILSGKLTPAQSKKPKDLELFLVEGDSAGGSAKLGRDRKFQAILPLRGKVVNAEKNRLVDIMKNEEIATIINAIGANVGPDFDIKKTNYHKVIIMTDADTDGAHIQILLLTFLFRFMKPLIENQMVYIAQPPLFKITYKKRKKNKIEYLWKETELSDLLRENHQIEIQRYKGLGEMNADQLWETTMNPEHRTLIRVNIEDEVIVERRVSTLMGDNVTPRKEWINKNVNFTLEDNFNIPNDQIKLEIDNPEQTEIQ